VKKIPFGKFLSCRSHVTILLSDHSDGLPSAIEAISNARHDRSSKVVVDLPKYRPSRRGIKLPNSDNVMIMNNPTFEELEKAGGEIVKSDESHMICSNFFYVSGKIFRRTKYETGLANHVAYDESLSTWKDDPLIMEERVLVARIKNKGLIVITGCGHAGIVNTLLQAQSPLSDKQKFPIYLVMGGFHLAGYEQESKIKETVRDLKELIDPAYLAPGHCTGWRCRAALEFQLHEGETAFAERVAPTAVGKIYNVYSK
jgi:7,8-dihydropterin-6-yl-methyl-4-(beta-D-ribofuranosyl)aminobenzene 5'-phosphate synthase